MKVLLHCVEMFSLLIRPLWTSFLVISIFARHRYPYRFSAIDSRPAKWGKCALKRDRAFSPSPKHAKTIFNKLNAIKMNVKQDVEHDSNLLPSSCSSRILLYFEVRCFNTIMSPHHLRIAIYVNELLAVLEFEQFRSNHSYPLEARIQIAHSLLDYPRVTDEGSLAPSRGIWHSEWAIAQEAYKREARWVTRAGGRNLEA